MDHNNKIKRMFTSSPARRLGLRGVLVLLGTCLFCAAFVGNVVGQQKVPPRTPQTTKIVVEKKPGVGNEAIKMLVGTLKGHVTVPRFSRRLVLENPLSIVVDDQSPQALNDSGTYLIKNLKPGTHKVKLVGRCWLVQSKTATIRSEQTTILNFNLGALNRFCGR